MNVRWVIERNGEYQWSGGWTKSAGHALAYPTREDAERAMEAARKAVPAAMQDACVVSKNFVMNDQGQWTEEAASAPTTAAPAPQAEEHESATAEEAAHPADAPQGLGDAEHVETLHRRTRLTQATERAALARFLGDPSGLAWMRRMLGLTHLTATSFSSDPLQMAFREGERNVGLFVLRETEAATGSQGVARLLTGKDS